MSIAIVDELAKEYRAALDSELVAKEYVENVRMAALSTAVIDGKNAEVRKQQLELALHESSEYALAEHNAAQCENVRKVVEAKIGLTKAWLYSQFGHGGGN